MSSFSTNDNEENITHVKENNFLKFATFANDYVKSNMTAPYFKRYHGQLTVCEHLKQSIRVNVLGYNVEPSFCQNYSDITQMSLMSTTSHHFPFQIYVNFVIDDKEIAHILTYEIWIHGFLFTDHLEKYGTFPFEVYFTNLLSNMTLKCNLACDLSNINNYCESKCRLVNDVTPQPFTRHWNEEVYPLFPHQVQSFRWMQELENCILGEKKNIKFNTSSIPILNTGYYYNQSYNIITNIHDVNIVSQPIRGGILADATGSGKTAVALALIVCNDQVVCPHTILTTELEKKIYFCSQATLIITPNCLSQQWLSEMKKFLNTTSLKIIAITNMREYKKIRLCELLTANIVITTDSFLNSKRYNMDVSTRAAALMQNSSNSHLKHTYLNMHHMAWRIAVHCNQTEHDDTIRSIPIESIKWKRVIIDEIHTFFDSKQNNDTISLLKGCFHWGLSASPMLQNNNFLQNYVRFLCNSPSRWVPEFINNFVNTCFHRFDGLKLGPIQRHLYIIEQTSHEKQLLMSLKDQISIEQQIQLCSYFNSIETNTIDVKMLTIDDLIKIVKKEKRIKLKELETKIKYLEMGITKVLTQIEEANEEIQRLGLADQQKDSQEVKEMQMIDTPHLNDIKLIDITFLDNDLHDVRDIIRGRKSRLNRMLKRKNDLQEEKALLDKSIDFFEAKIDCVKSHTIENCPICMTDAANVITQCGHLFCRTCIVRCLKQNYQCPICKTTVTPTDAHEIQMDNKKMIKIDDVHLYGSKFARILDLVKSIVTRKEQVIVFVQWVPLITAMFNMFHKHKIQVGLVTGNVIQQNNVLQKFKQGKYNVLIGMVNTTGLDLSNANHLIFAHAIFGDEYIVQAIEEQSIARIHRMGQTRFVNIYWFITRDTIEQKTYLQTRRCLFDPLSDLIPSFISHYTH